MNLIENPRNRFHHLTIGIIAFIWVGLFVPSSTLASPDKTISYLMAEPVTMLDWGIENMESFLKKSFEDPKEPLSPDIFVNYYYKPNRIRIELNYNLKNGDLTIPQAMEWSLGSLTTVRNLFISQQSSENLKKLVEVGRFFEHLGFDRKNKPNGLNEKIERLVEIEAQAFSMDKKTWVLCRGDLMKKDSSCNIENLD